MDNNCCYFNVTVLMNLILENINSELDSTIEILGHYDKYSFHYIYANMISVMDSMAVIAKQICKSRISSGFHIEVGDDGDVITISFVFESDTDFPYRSDTEIPDYAPALDMDREAVKYACNTFDRDGCELAVSKFKNFVSFDFSFGRIEKSNGGTLRQDSDIGELRSAFSKALLVF